MNKPLPDYRYERKFLVKDVSRHEIELYIKHHPKAFKEIFHSRQVNNIYFDTPGLINYFDNVEGNKSRVKVRLRWYDNLFGHIEKPVLEYKIKEGFVGTKRSYKLAPFTLDTKFSRKNIESALDVPHLNQSIKDDLLALNPALLNHYTRKYFLSDDKKYRITLDYDPVYYGISYDHSTFLNKSVDYNTVIIELKYFKEDDEFASEISSKIPFMLTKSSKYLQGLERVLL